MTAGAEMGLLLAQASSGDAVLSWLLPGAEILMALPRGWRERGPPAQCQAWSWSGQKALGGRELSKVLPGLLELFAPP